jgi:hypothetical protein
MLRLARLYIDQITLKSPHLNGVIVAASSALAQQTDHATI